MENLENSNRTNIYLISIKGYTVEPGQVRTQETNSLIILIGFSLIKVRQYFWLVNLKSDRLSANREMSIKTSIIIMQVNFLREESKSITLKFHSTPNTKIVGFITRIDRKDS